MNIDLNAKPLPKCRHCGRSKGSHKAETLACPWGLSRTFPNFRSDQFYSPKEKRQTKP